MEKVLITGCAGLVGYECVRKFAEEGYKVIGVDNFMRGKLFGEEGDTAKNLELLMKNYEFEFHNLDVRDEGILELLKKVEIMVHTAAQPSHPKSIEIPLEDFMINAYGTLFLLESLRKHNKECVFIFCSTNKVYGEIPNYFAYKIVGKRYEPLDKTIWDGFDENLRIDQNMHTPFGVSKVCADLYTQEYAYLYGLKTGIFRMGCITGGAARAVEMHNWEPYFVKKALTGEKLHIYGYKGYQVRDVIHAKDLAELFYKFSQNPRPGEVYNVGGSRKNSISLLEAIDLIEEITGKRINYEYAKEREADHIWWISNIQKAKEHYKWDIKIKLKEIFKEIYESLAPIYEK
jgi:CDP-paratose 2-epimerase